MIILGIDPGKTGGIASLQVKDDTLDIIGVAAVAMPATENGIVDQLRKLLQIGDGRTVAYLELVHAMPATRQTRNSDLIKDICIQIAGGFDPRITTILERAGVGMETKMMQGIVGTFTFAQGYGVLRGILRALEIPIVDVRPQDWQRVNGCMTRGNKNISKERAVRVFPQIPKVTHATADALLIANYGYKISRSDQIAKERRA
jgi:hypothetical protein